MVSLISLVLPQTPSYILDPPLYCTFVVATSLTNFFGEVDIEHYNGCIEHKEEWLHLKRLSVLHKLGPVDHKQNVEQNKAPGGEGRLHP